MAYPPTRTKRNSDSQIFGAASWILGDTADEDGRNANGHRSGAAPSGEALIVNAVRRIAGFFSATDF
jgi:hypothetical protein